MWYHLFYLSTQNQGLMVQSWWTDRPLVYKFSSLSLTRSKSGHRQSSLESQNPFSTLRRERAALAVWREEKPENKDSAFNPIQEQIRLSGANFGIQSSCNFHCFNPTCTLFIFRLSEFLLNFILLQFSEQKLGIHYNIYIFSVKLEFPSTILGKFVHLFYQTYI